ncbi:hypothetical protein Q4578_06810 [Shimia thalassica]|uniref:hypothetical protein n=1 Tax=Shimia thalassica TaxID=1715693 RepID=UPI0026E27441|nr:hypothetical protein [Shimia thalassica]MDO6521290.1 hypothetical protein [Shimia thalassica]
MQAPTYTYITDTTYHTLNDELAHLIAMSFVHDPETEVIRILGEVGGVWPQSVMDDVEAQKS